MCVGSAGARHTFFNIDFYIRMYEDPPEMGVLSFLEEFKLTLDVTPSVRSSHAS